MKTELVPIYLEQSIAPQAAEFKIIPLAVLFTSFIKATGQRSKHTARAYGQSVGIFLQWLGERLGENLAKPTQDGRKTVWEIRGDTTPLFEVDLATFDDFALWLQSQGNKQATINERLAAVNSFMSVALRDKVIPRDQGIDLGIRPYKAKQKAGRVARRA